MLVAFENEEWRGVGKWVFALFGENVSGLGKNEKFEWVLSGFWL